MVRSDQTRRGVPWWSDPIAGWNPLLHFNTGENCPYSTQTYYSGVQPLRSHFVLAGWPDLS